MTNSRMSGRLNLSSEAQEQPISPSDEPTPLQWPHVSYVNRSDPALVKLRMQEEREQKRKAQLEEQQRLQHIKDSFKPASTPAVASFQIPDLLSAAAISLMAAILLILRSLRKGVTRFRGQR